MGATYLVFCLSDLDAGNWIDIAAILINGLLAVWIVLVIQNNFTNKRVLKDHFISEVKEIQGEFKTFFKDVSAGSLDSREVTPWFKLMNIKITDLMSQLATNYKVNEHLLKPYQTDLRNMTTDSDEYIAQYSIGGHVTFLPTTKNEFIQFQQQNSKLFNALIEIINNSKA